jgi:hypothetical protein
MKPKVLIAATERWFPTARIAMSLANAGCIVEFVCPAGHPVSKTRAASRIHAYNGLFPLGSFTRAIHAASPDLVIPADDLATRHLHEIYKREQGNRATGSKICRLIERSLGSPDSFEMVYARSAFLQLAQEEGIRTPKTEVVAGENDLLTWIAHMSLPVVIKANGTSGGDGVRIAKTVEEAETAFRKLHAPPLMARAVKHAVIDRDLTLLKPSLMRRRPTVNAQSFVTGHEATSAMFCWEGTVLAGLHFEVLQKVNATGHATVVKRIEHPEMSAAGAKIARRLKLSGFYGLDFMLETGTRNAYLIEINPRTTQVGHLALGPGSDLPAAVYSALTGKSIEPAPAITSNDTIALFPQEWKRDPASSFLQSAYHDVPQSEPELVSACVNQARKGSHSSREAAFDQGVLDQSVLNQGRVPSSCMSVPVAESRSAAWIADQK